MTGEVKWREAADRLLAFLCGHAADYPAGVAFALTALQGRVYPTRELVCAADAPTEMLRSVAGRYTPELTVLLKKPGDALLAQAAPFTAGMTQLDGKPTYYLCQNGACGLPFTE